MKRHFYFLFVGILAVSFLSCSETVSTTVNTAPTASAGSTQDVNVSSTVTLDASASADADSDTLTYAWTQTSGTTVTLSSTTAAQPTFTAGTGPQTYLFSLIVNDGTDSSTASTVTIRVWNDQTLRLFVIPEATAGSTPDGTIANPYDDLETAIGVATASG
ncbi:MAG: PKD domain-containing protein, partial [bacterium]|nr:PKD domain-containing protein [bacterium]